MSKPYFLGSKTQADSLWQSVRWCKSLPWTPSAGWRMSWHRVKHLLSFTALTWQFKKGFTPFGGKEIDRPADSDLQSFNPIRPAFLLLINGCCPFKKGLTNFIDNVSACLPLWYTSVCCEVFRSISGERAHGHTIGLKAPQVLCSVSVPLRLPGLSEASTHIKACDRENVDAAWPAANTANWDCQRGARRRLRLRFGFRVKSLL